MLFRHTAWYDDEHKEGHTETYANAELAAQDAHRAAAKGWEVQSRTTGSSWFPIWRGQLTTASLHKLGHQRGEVELTFIRTEEWLEVATWRQRVRRGIAASVARTRRSWRG
jgi:hypothetical protein